MAYLPFQPTKPDGANTPPVYGDDDLRNIRALRDAVVCGFMPGWSFSHGGADPWNPTLLTWLSGVLGFRVKLTWVANKVTTAAWEYTENSGGLWTNINTGGTAAAVTTHANGMITAVDKDAGMWIFALTALMRIIIVEGALNSHAAGVGNAVHGLGTISTQNANNINVTGGTASAIAAVLLTRLSPAAPPTLTTANPFDWAARPTMVEMAAGGTISALNNAVGGEMKRILVVGNGAITITPGAGKTLTWGTGHPVWGVNFTIVNIVARSSTTFLATTIPF